MSREIPLEHFFRKPDKTHVRLSPSGRYLAWLGPVDRRLNLHVEDLETGETRTVTRLAGRDIATYAWADEDWLVFSLDLSGSENFHLYAVRREGSEPSDLTPFEGVRCSVLDLLEEAPGEILVQANRRRADVFDVYRLSIETGKMALIGENPGMIQTWMADHQGQLRLGAGRQGDKRVFLYREEETAPWTMSSFDAEEGYIEPLLFKFESQSIYVASNLGRDTIAIFEWDPETVSRGQAIFQHDDVDVEILLASRARRRILGVAFYTDRLRYHFFEPERRAIQRFMDRELPDFENSLISSSRDEKRHLILSRSDRNPGRYSLLDLGASEGPRLRHLFDRAPWLPEGRMARMEAIRYRARDGLAINGYLTRPPEPRAGKPPPLVVRPHGGPWVRDTFGFHPEVQFFASRGYAVIQMNYRGSTGYGRKFLEAGFRQWGLAMQDDITDAVLWAIGRGIADRERIAIYGRSYGGYAALMGLAKTPHLYACGVSYAGISNLLTWLDGFPPYWRSYLQMIYERIGDPLTDEKQLRETSPLFQVDRIQAPLFVAQGANDPRVKRDESDQIVTALREKGIDVEYLIRWNEGHTFHNEENALDFYRKINAFLKNCLKNR